MAPGYDGREAPLAAPTQGWAELSGIVCDGSGSVLAIGEAMVWHNEALARIDAALHASVVGGPLTDPPSAPSIA